MAEFRMQIAGCTAAVTSLFESTRDYCRRYPSEDTPDFFIRVTPADLEREQQLALEEAREEGFRPRIFPDPFLERAAIQRQFAEYLLERGTLLFHGSALALDGRAYLFTARSGTGKSTHTRLWREVFGSRTLMINDDKPFLRFEAGGILVCGAPWSGKHGLDSNVALPLKGLCLLERGAENRIRPMEPEAAFPMLLHESYCPLQAEKQPLRRRLAGKLAQSVPLWHMECNKDPQAAAVAAAAMTVTQSSFKEEAPL